MSLVIFGLAVSPSYSLAFEFRPAGLTPCSVWYFLETAKEELILFFTFDASQKFDKLIDFSSEKMSELNEVLAKNPSRAPTVLRRASSFVQRAKKLAGKVKKEKDFSLQREKWLETLAQELVFLTEKRFQLPQVEPLIKSIKELRHLLL